MTTRKCGDDDRAKDRQHYGMDSSQEQWNTCSAFVEERVMELSIATKNDLTCTKVEIIKWEAGMLVAQAAIVATLVSLL